MCMDTFVTGFSQIKKGTAILIYLCKINDASFSQYLRKN